MCKLLYGLAFIERRVQWPQNSARAGLPRHALSEKKKGSRPIASSERSVQQAQGGKSLAPCHIACICSSRQKGNIFGRLANGRPIQENKFGIHGMSHFLIAPPTLIAGSDALHQHLAVCTPNHQEVDFNFP